MAKNDQNEYPLPTGNDKITSSNLLPRFFRTTSNINFLQATLDQLIQPGVAEKVSGYFGRKNAKAYNAQTDNYIDEISADRENYQFEPATVIKDNLDNVNFYADYIDYINSVKSQFGNVTDHSRLNSQESYAWNPNIDWDKFANFREYYWLPEGPQPIPVKGQALGIESTYTVSLVEDDDNFAYVFSPNGFTRNPTIQLFRGQTYRFEIDTPGHPVAFAVTRSFTPGTVLISAGRDGIRGPGLFDTDFYDEADTSYDLGPFVVFPEDPNIIGTTEGENVSTIYSDGIEKTDDEGNPLQIVYVEKGIIEFTVPFDAPDRLYYISKNDVNTSGQIRIADIEDNTSIDVEAEILGKKEYITEDSVKLSNGMKLYFQGQVTPEKYSEGLWYVEGVGDKIKLVNALDLIIPASYAEDRFTPFDSQGFDTLPFSYNASFPENKDYIVTNRSSLDKNAWSRFNRWFHIDVIKRSAEVNGTNANLDQNLRAKRPIIEFEAGLKLYNFGTQAKKDVDLIDNYTQDVFSTIEGSVGYNIDGIDITDGMRILFTADTDILVRNKIYIVNFLLVKGQRQISLIESEDTNPLDLETVLVTKGNQFAGKSFYYENDEWNLGQEKTKLNQPPMFDMFSTEGVSYKDNVIYPSSSFNGNKVFSYKEGTGTEVDSELGFPLEYRTIENSGDIVFDFNLLSGEFSYETDDQQVVTEITDNGYLKKYSDRETFAYQNGWSNVPTQTYQYVIRQYVSSNSLRNNFEIDVYNRAGDLNDLKVLVFVNNNLQKNLEDYEIDRLNGKAFVRFYNPLTTNQNVLIKTRSVAKKNQNGYYEIPTNLERNPLNENINDFTLGEVIDHVKSITEEAINFEGEFPGKSNLRDLGELDHFGRRFMKHSGPINLASYHLISKDNNIINSIRFAKDEYSKFKRVFLQTAESSGYSGPIKTHVDLLLEEINKDKIPSMPFYFSDMSPFGPARKLEYEVLDPNNPFYAVSEPFNLNEISSKAILVYLNGTLLLKDRDYSFNNEGFGIIVAGQEIGDLIEIYEYESTDGNFIPPTPTKLGLYPAYEPSIFVDDTYREPTKVIQGHDGSIVVAFNDYRDDLLLELERRIFNNIKQQYNPEIFDINDYVGGFYRNTGFSKQEIDDTLLSDFLKWNQLVEEDYTDNSFYNRVDQFVFNYSSMSGPNNESLPGFWRAIYKQAFDTERPHSHPWEMLGFAIKPTWWNDVYGPAPYTNNNLILWEDLEEGLIREPNKLPIRKSKYARPGLLTNIPVDSQGNLLSPLESNLAKNYIASYTRRKFVFGDNAPVESAWRRSSEYPFSLITSYLLNQPAKVLGTGFDLSRTSRNLAGQLVYKETDKCLELSELLFPNTFEDETRLTTSGLVNYIYNYVAGYVTSVYDDYIQDIKNIKNQIGFRVKGFTDKSKFNLILDSRTPYNQGNVFVPEESYQVFLHKSSPVDTAVYSGVIVQKGNNGYIIRGYNSIQPFFEYYETIPTASDPTITVGGVSETFNQWAPNKRYYQDQLLEFNNSYYRVTQNFTSSEVFDSENLASIPELPIKGGKRALFRDNFRKSKLLKLDYGSSLRTSQEVIDFLLGYGEYLKDQGFEFDLFDNNRLDVRNWKLSAREFLFWTTQNWSIGTAISLSPSAEYVNFKREYTTVDDLFNQFYGYGLILNADGRQIPNSFDHFLRADNGFGLTLTNTNEGIYHLRLPLIQKEHIVLLDNKTRFNDIIYKTNSGYRQERIKVSGYRTDNWNGTLNAPGFVYDQAAITTWESWKDYSIGDTVKYKEFYYTALSNIQGTEDFESSSWQVLNEEPKTGLKTNFDYSANQFADFYDLDSDGFDEGKQKLAQHLIGYQPRKYLANIIQDDISQFKFYQGFIQDKGTKNSIDKLFDALNSAEKDSLEFYEEWAIQLGQYGNSDRNEEVEIVLDESKIDLSPQPIELVEYLPDDNTDKVYRQRPFELYYKPLSYDSQPFPAKTIDQEYIKSSGFVREEDIDWKVKTNRDLLYSNIDRLLANDYIWVTFDNTDWNIYQYISTKCKVVSVKNIDNDLSINPESNNFVFKIVLDRYPLDEISVGDYVAVPNAGFYNLTKFYKVLEIVRDEIFVELPTNADIPVFLELAELQPLTKLRSVRFDDINSANNLIQDFKSENQKLWIDDTGNGNWSVLENTETFNFLSSVSNPSTEDSTYHGFANSFSVTKNNKNLAVGSPGDLDGRVHVYRRSNDFSEWQYDQTLLPPPDATTSDAAETQFGYSVAYSPDGEILAVGSPRASNVKTRYKGDFDSSRTYTKAEIVKYKENLWKANREILAEINNQQYNTFNSYYDIVNGITVDSTELQMLLTGDINLPNENTDHVLIRAPKNAYLASSIGDKIYLDWNNNSVTFSTLQNYEPFNDELDIKGSDLTGEFTIERKVEEIVYLPNYIALPQIGDTVTTNVAAGEVVYIKVQNQNAIIYLENVSGIFDLQGNIFINDEIFIGTYEIPVTNLNTDVLGGYWYLEVPSYDNGETFIDVGRGLVFVDLIRSEESRLKNVFSNVYDNVFAIGNYTGRKLQSSQILNLSYSGNPYNTPGNYLSDLIAVRAPRTTEFLNLENLDPIDLKVTYNSNFAINFENKGFTEQALNKEHTIFDQWDGFIDFEYSEFDFSGNPFEPVAKYYYNNGILVERPEGGDIIVDKQIPFDQFGGLAITSNTTSAAEVMFYQRDFLGVRIYVKLRPDIYSGNFELYSNNIARYELIRLGNDAIRGPGDPDRDIGVIDDIEEGLSLINSNNNIGKLIVFRNTETIPETGNNFLPIVDSPEIVDREYWLFKNTIGSGDSRSANIPNSSNKDWTQVYNIPVDDFGESITKNSKNEGFISFYRKDSAGGYSYIRSIVSLYRDTEREFGTNIKISQIGKEYQILVTSQGNSTFENYGRLEIIRHGLDLDQESRFKGNWSIDSDYSLGDIVIFRGEYYEAITDLIQNPNIPIIVGNTAYWKNLSFRYGVDSNYKGGFSQDIPYREGEIVKAIGPDSSVERLYRAKTNISINSTFNSNQWEILSAGIDYLGYLPNDSGYIAYNYKEFDKDTAYNIDSLVNYQGEIYKAVEDIVPPAIIENRRFNPSEWELQINARDEDVYIPTSDIIQFANKMSLSEDGQVLAVTSVQQTDSTPETVVLVYRQLSHKFYLDQIIYPTVPNTGFAHSISLSPDAQTLVISEPFDDVDKIDQGKVHVYRFDTTRFVKTQTFTSPNNEESEKFGYTVEANNNYIAITSINGDIKVSTSFDDGKTTFDNNFTRFNGTYFDTGVVYTYENINGVYLYAEKFAFADPNVFFFGENILLQNNHVYLGMPRVRIAEYPFFDKNKNYSKNDVVQRNGIIYIALKDIDLQLRIDDRGFNPEDWQSVGDIQRQSRGFLTDYRQNVDSRSWSQLRTPQQIVDTSRITGAFLYNKKTNDLLTYLDFVDIIQGKLPGPVEQELHYKVPYDPALYNVSSVSSVFSNTNFWAEKYVGQLWWDISESKFLYPYEGNVIEQTNKFNKLDNSARIDVYEWVETDLKPSEWDALADSEEGLRRGISGQSLYSDSIFATQSKYDEKTKTYQTRNYFWVRNKSVIPTVENRTISSLDVTKLLSNTSGSGYRYIEFLSNNRLVLHNCNSFLNNNDVVLSIRYNKNGNLEQNNHTQYQILSEGLDSSRINNEIEKKWFDSLIGYDENLRVVPDPKLAPKYKYGNRNTPRQSMFVNKEEALKQVIERVNSVLKETIITDLYNIAPLYAAEQPPSLVENRYDQVIDSLEELRFVGTSKIRPAILESVIRDGKITRVNIIDSGRGYKTQPTYEVLGSGTGAEFEFEINNLGQITNVTVIDGGENYETASISVRPFAVLINSDSSVYGKWAIYRWNSDQKEWYRYKVQEYDTTLFWDFEDWYAKGYNEFTRVNHTIDQSYQLQTVDISLGEIVKINSIGSGGWLLLRKIANTDAEDYTIDYETIGRQSGTIQFKNNLYDLEGNSIGYDNRNYDSYFYDNQPVKETRIILETLRDNIFIADLAVEYNKLWFASLRYVFAEQGYVDWAFKTSFIKTKHNLGELDTPATFKSNTLPSYIDYIEEAKPYSTTIREFITAHEAFDNTSSLTSDFDLPPVVDSQSKQITTLKPKVVNGVLTDIADEVIVYPRKNWLDNVGYEVTQIEVADGGSGYTFKPRVFIEGGGGSGAIAEAYISGGRITEIKVIDPGKGYLAEPTIRIEGSQTDEGTPARASVILGNSVIKTTRLNVKFDRVSGKVYINNLATSQTFFGTGAKFIYDLEWPMDLQNAKVKVFLDNREALRSEYVFRNIANNEKSYVRQKGQLEFTNPPGNEAEIRVEYSKPMSLLTAQDRIVYGYTPQEGMFGIGENIDGTPNFSQLMDGIDYGGVEVRSFEFEGPSGWDSGEWYSDTWDTFDNTFEDDIFTFDGSTVSIQLSKPLENGVEYNVYLNGVRIDDPNFDSGKFDYEGVIINSIIGDGETQTLFLDELGIVVGDADVLIIRKATSDGSFLPDPDSYDTQLSGGDLTYQTAQGINAEDIIVDGDGFVTPTTSKGPEEIVPGQLVDTLDIKVYHRESDGQGVIASQSYLTDGSTNTFELGVSPNSPNAVFVKLGDRLLNLDEFTVDWQTNTVSLTETPEADIQLNIRTVSNSQQRILDIFEFTGNGTTFDFETGIVFDDNISAHVTVNGIKTDATILKGEDSTVTSGDTTVVRLDTPPAENTVIKVSLFLGDDEINYSQVTNDVYTGDGSATVYTLSQEPLYKTPTAYNTVVQVDNDILNAGYNKQFVIESTNSLTNFDNNSTDLVGTTQYQLELFQQPAATLQVEDILVYLNGEQLNFPAEWRFDVFNNAVELVPGVGQVGDILEIYVVTDGDYTITGDEIVFKNPPADGSVIKIYRFTNHDILNIERINYDVVARSSLTAGSEEYVTYHRLTKGEISLRSPAVDAQYVWVILNGELLAPTTDYYLTDDLSKIQLLQVPTEDDVLEVIHFTAPIVQSKFAFRQFKDMLNRTHYKRLDSSSTKVSQDLNYYDIRIEVEDGSVLPEPNKGQNIPGVIWIDGERIEYLVKDGNTLRQLRRGTLGTGINEFIPADTNIYDQSTLKNIPYKDETLIQNFTADGLSQVYALDYVPESTDEFEVFVAGRRLRKTSIQSYDNTIAQDSPEGDITLSAEFSLPVFDLTDSGRPLSPAIGSQYNQNGYVFTWNGSEWKSNSLILLDVPTENTRITVIRKVGKTWTNFGESLAQAQGEIANFLRAGYSDLLE